MSVDIDGPQKTEVTKKAGSSGATIFSYTPMSAGEYNISVKAKGKHIHGSPFNAKVSGRLKIIVVILSLLVDPIISLYMETISN